MQALEAGGVAVDIVGLGPAGDHADESTASLLHRVKRRILPISLRRRVEAELAGSNISGPTISLVPSANRWALRGHPTWLDYSDLWSNIALNHALTVDRLSAVCNRAQARLWARREAAEYPHADVVTVASWSDHQQLGKGSIWLPHPVGQANDLPNRRPSPSLQTGAVYGLLGNFDYPPNRDAYDRLINEWLPVLRRSSRKIIVAGFGSERLPRVPDVDVIGPVDTVATFYESIDVALAPVERGGGMKVKVVEAMMHGIPVVATQHAKDGLPDALVAECVDLRSLQDGPESYHRTLRNPRENPDVASALNNFTYQSFEQTINDLWRNQMVAR